MNRSTLIGAWRASAVALALGMAHAHAVSDGNSAEVVQSGDGNNAEIRQGLDGSSNQTVRIFQGGDSLNTFVAIDQSGGDFNTASVEQLNETDSRTEIFQVGARNLAGMVIGSGTVAGAGGSGNTNRISQTGNDHIAQVLQTNLAGAGITLAPQGVRVTQVGGDFNQAYVSQTGTGLAFDLIQSGFRNLVNASAATSAPGTTPIILTGQSGTNSEAVLAQTGNDNRIDLGQAGDGSSISADQVGNLNTAEISQTGNSDILVLSQTGASNEAYLSQLGDSNEAYVTQLGDANQAYTTQVGSANQAWVTQTGIGNVANIGQTGNANSAAVTQVGNNNTSFISQGQ